MAYGLQLIVQRRLYLHCSLAIVLILLNVLHVSVLGLTCRSLYYLLRTWLTEPGIIMKDPTSEDEMLPQATASSGSVVLLGQGNDVSLDSWCR